MSKCNLCKYRQDVPGDAHIRCEHPYVKDNPLVELACLMSEAMVTQLGQHLDSIFEPLNIQANEYGVKKGWFCWPVNFDPVWLENCDGFSEKVNKL
jgi:hypothetical protein